MNRTLKWKPITGSHMVSRVGNIVTGWIREQWPSEGQTFIVPGSRERGLRHGFKHKERFHMKTAGSTGIGTMSLVLPTNP